MPRPVMRYHTENSPFAQHPSHGRSPSCWIGRSVPRKAIRASLRSATSPSWLTLTRTPLLSSFKKAELKTFLQFHREGEEPLRDDEITILNGVLSLNDRKASEIMTHIKDVLCLPSDHVLDHPALDHILLSGFSRIPVYEPGQKENFVGMLLVKRVSLSGVYMDRVALLMPNAVSEMKLISYNPEECKKVSEFPLLSLPEARPDINCKHVRRASHDQVLTSYLSQASKCVPGNRFCGPFMLKSNRAVRLLTTSRQAVRICS